MSTQAPPSAGWLEMSKTGTFLRRWDELLLWSQLGLKSQQKTFKNVWQVELVIGFQDVDFCGGMSMHLPSRVLVFSPSALSHPSGEVQCWRRFQSPCFLLKLTPGAVTSPSPQGAQETKLGTCVERSSPKRRCSLFRSSISWTKRSFQEVCPGLCQEIGDSIFSRLNRLFQIVLA